MKTTLDLPDELIHAVKLRAVMQRRTVKDLVADFLRQGLGMSPPAQGAAPAAGSLIDIGPDGLPRVRCQAGAPATRMGALALLQIEQAALAEEDLRRAGMPG
jgi:plasmid stability protein